MKLRMNVCELLMGLVLAGSSALAADCSNLPTQFKGSEFPSGDFFSNFNNSCYTIRLTQGNGSTGKAGDLNSTYYKLYFKVDPRYQIILLGTFPDARYFSITLYDAHSAVSQSLTDTSIAPLTSQQVNPFQPGVTFVPAQQFAVPIDFGGTPATIETGCSMNGYNVHANKLDATLRHHGMDWNTDQGVFQANPNFANHIVDTPQHSNPNTAGTILIRSYLDITPSGYMTNPHVIVRDVASGCAYPAAYVLSNMQVVSTSPSWLDQTQVQDHKFYNNQYLQKLCYAKDSQNQLSWFRGSEYVSGGNPDSSYVEGLVPANMPASLAAAGRVMRVRLRVPTAPPTPCRNGCSRSGDEQMRYMSLSFQDSGGITLASVADRTFATDTNGYATLIVGTGTKIPSWITAANGYTLLDLTTSSGYRNLNMLFMRNILPANSFGCSGKEVPYGTGAATPAGNLMGDYLPVVDYPVAATLPQTATPLVGPNSCGVFPNGVPAPSPSCAVLPAPTPAINLVVTQCPAPGCNQVVAQSHPPFTITGSGFGSFPQGLPYTGNSNYFEIIDTTQNWHAGYTGGACDVSISEWSDGRIALMANIAPTGPCPVISGDQIVVQVWNPQTMAAPAAATVTVSGY